MKNKSLKPKILILFWHSSDSLAGGFTRLREFLPYFRNLDITIVDNKPEFIKKEDFSNLKVLVYTIPPSITQIYRINYVLGRFIEWLFSLYSLVAIGVKELKDNDYKLIYGPTGDNPHIFFAGIILKFLFPKKKLLLDVLNLEVPEGGAYNYYNSFRENNVSFIESFIRAFGLSILIFLQKKFIRKCDFVITVSPYMQKIISKNYDSKKISYTPSGVKIPIFYKLSRKEYDAVYIGRHTKEKGIFDVIEVLKKTQKLKRNIKFITAGSIQPEVKNLLLENSLKAGISNNLELKGLVDEQKKWEIIGKSKVFLHLAYFEPLVPVITILEALGAGIPVITYYVKAFDDYPYLKKNKAIYIIYNKDIDKAAEVLLKILIMKKPERKIIEKEAKSIASKFIWSQIAKKELKIIKNLIDN